MKKHLIIITVIISVLSCKKNSKNDITTDNLNLEVFKIIPDTIDGCGEYFKMENEKEGSQNFIFLSNLTNFGIIKINNKNIFLKRDTLKSKEMTNGNIYEEYYDKEYKVILKTKIIEKYDEGGFFKGTLKIKKNNNEKEFKVKGTSGC